MTQQYTLAQLEAWTKLGPWTISPLVTPPLIYSDKKHGGTGLWIASIYADAPGEREHHKINAALIAAAPDLARLVLEKEKEIARLKGLAWIAYHEFNAINARSGGPLDQYGMVTVTHEYWQAITDLFAKAAGETTPWPTENAKAIFEEINRQAMKETSDE